MNERTITVKILSTVFATMLLVPGLAAANNLRSDMQAFVLKTDEHGDESFAAARACA